MLIVTVWFLDAVYKFNVAYLTAERPDRSDRHDERPPEESKCKNCTEPMGVICVCFKPHIHISIIILLAVYIV